MSELFDGIYNLVSTFKKAHSAAKSGIAKINGNSEDGQEGAAAAGGVGASLLKGGIGDSSLVDLTKNGVENLRNLTNSNLSKMLKEDGKFAGFQSRLSGFAKGLDEMQIPQQAFQFYQNMRSEVLTSGVIPQVAATVLDTFYGIGEQMPSPIGPLVGAMHDIVKPTDVQLVLHRMLNDTENKFFKQVEDSDSFKGLQAELNRVLSCENIANVTTFMTNSVLQAGVAATNDGASFSDAVDVMKKRAAEFKTDEGIERFSENFGQMVTGTLGEVGKGALGTVVSVATSDEVSTAGKNAFEGIGPASKKVGTAAKDTASLFMKAASMLSGFIKM